MGPTDKQRWEAELREANKRLTAAMGNLREANKHGATLKAIAHADEVAAMLRRVGELKAALRPPSQREPDEEICRHGSQYRSCDECS